MRFVKYANMLLMASVLLLIRIPVLHATPIADPNLDPFVYFHVYSLGDITYSTSDFQGITGTAGNFEVNNFSLYNLEGNKYALHAGGSVDYRPGSINGAIEAGRDVNIGNITVNGDVHTGGDANHLGGGGTINGHVYAAGSVNFSVLGGTLTSWGEHPGTTPYSPVADHTAISDYFVSYSNMVSLMDDTGVIINSYGALTINAESGINVFTIDAATLLNAYRMTINGPSDARVYINVDGATTTLNWTEWIYNGIPTKNVLLNYWQATSLSYSSSNIVNLLAPFADTSFSGGVHTGSFIVGNLSGTGQVNLGHFSAPPIEDSPSPVPEPASMLLFGTGLVGLASTLKKKYKKMK